MLVMASIIRMLQSELKRQKVGISVPYSKLLIYQCAHLLPIVIRASPTHICTLEMKNRHN
jgi:hypothetical protein